MPDWVGEDIKEYGTFQPFSRFNRGDQDEGEGGGLGAGEVSTLLEILGNEIRRPAVPIDYPVYVSTLLEILESL